MGYRRQRARLAKEQARLATMERKTAEAQQLPWYRQRTLRSMFAALLARP